MGRSKTIKDFIVEMRKLQRESQERGALRLTKYDQRQEEEKFLRYLNRQDIVVNFIELEVYENLVIWGGTIDDVFKFFYRVTPETNDFEFKFLDGFDPLGHDTDESDEYVEKQMKLFNDVKNYFEQFTEYWRSELEMNKT